MSHRISPPLSSDKETLGRAVIAEFEWKQQQQRSERRARTWKLAMMIGAAGLAIAGGAFVRARQIPITTYDICGWLIVMAVTAGFAQYGFHEKILKLRVELDELKQAVRDVEAKQAD